MSLVRRSLGVLPLAALGNVVLAGAQVYAGTVPADALRRCAAIAAPDERLACYDQLAGRTSPSTMAVPLAVQPSPATPLRSAPPAVPLESPKESFGLYSVEHPASPKPDAVLTAKITALGVSANGHSTVSLDIGQLWELGDADPLLAPGDSVTIKRAAFGSFLMTTPHGRTHRLHRLR
jgi:hypothetical protein